MDTKIVIAFNNLLLEFLKFLEENFPSESAEFKKARTDVQIAYKAIPLVPSQEFYMYTHKYEKHIRECNEEFFLEYDFNKEFGVETGSFKELYMSSEDLQKANLWSYIQKLFNLSKKIHSV